MKAIFKSRQPRQPRRPAARPRLEALEARLTPSAAAVPTAVLKTDGELDLLNTQAGVSQMLSPAGTIASVSAAYGAGSQRVVFAVASDADAAGNLNTLWEYNTGTNAWSEVSTGYFRQVSAATSASGAVFGVLGQGAFSGYANSLWEFNNGGWRELSFPPAHFAPDLIVQGGQAQNPPGLVQSVSAVGTSQGDVAFAIGFDSHLYEYTPSGWSQASSGTFQQVSAGLDANGQADAFGVVTTGPMSSDIWEFSNNAWTALTGPDVQLFPGAGSRAVELPTEYVVTAGRKGEVFIVNSRDANLAEEGGPSGYVLLSVGGSLSFAQVSATTTAESADVVFGTLSDGSLWEYTNGYGVTTGWTELLSGGVAATAAPCEAAPGRPRCNDASLLTVTP